MIDLSTFKVLVTAVGGNSVGGQVLRALAVAEQPPRVYACDASPWSEGLYRPSLAGSGRIPRADDPAYLEALADRCRNWGIDAVISGSEPEMFVLAEVGAAVRVPALVMGNRPELIRLQGDKLELAVYCAAHSIPHARTAAAESLPDSARAWGYPIQVKARYRAGGSRGAAVLATEGEVDAWLEQCPDPSFFVCQEYLPFEDNEYTVEVLTQDDGSVIDSIALRRLLTGIGLRESREWKGRALVTSTGFSQGLVCEFPEVREQCEAISRKLDSRGPLNIQGRLIGRQFVPFELHFRFSGTTSIRALLGFNSPVLLLGHRLLGLRFGRQEYRKDVAVLRSLENRVVPLVDLQ